MSKSLLIAIGALVLLLAGLGPAERALMRWTGRRLDRSRRVLRAFVFLFGIAAWGYGSYLRLYPISSNAWFFIFLLVAGLWKLIVDVLIFGVPDRPGAA